MVRAMSALERGDSKLTPQAADGVTYAAKIDKDEARIDWARPAREVLRHCHGLSPFPGRLERDRARRPGGASENPSLRTCVRTRCAGRGDRRQADGRVWRGAIRIVELQRAGAKPMTSEVFLRGTRLLAGSRMR